MHQLYKKESLETCAKQLLEQFREAASVVLEKGEDEKKDWRKNFEVKWEDETDCFDEVVLRTYYEGGRLVVLIGVFVYSEYSGDRGEVTTSLRFAKNLEEAYHWMGTEKAIRKCVETEKELIRFWWDKQKEHGEM